MHPCGLLGLPCVGKHMCDCRWCAQVPVVEAGGDKANDSAAAGAAGKAEAGAKGPEEVGSLALCAALIGLTAHSGASPAR